MKAINQLTIQYILLHLFRLYYQIRNATNEHKSNIEQRKKNIQNTLKKQLNILVDAPKQNYGNTNDGNTARSFFNNVEQVARITGFDLEILKRLKTILSVISCGYPVEVQKFKIFCLETARMYAEQYQWYYMPTSAHIILIHGWEVIEFLVTPIGMLSEEALESTHKYLKSSRINHARKNSRVATNEDMFNLLLLSSDPGLTVEASSPKKRTDKFSEDLKALIIYNED